MKTFYKILAATLATVLALSLLWIFPAAADESVSLGDVNRDGRIDTTDARLVLQSAVGKITEINSNTLADVNSDGKCDTTYARLILQYAVGKITEFPFLNNTSADGNTTILSETGTTTVTEPSTTIGSAFYSNAEEVEAMTDQQLINEVKQTDKFRVPGFCEPDDFGVPLASGEIWQDVFTSSASTVNEARDIAVSFAAAQHPLWYTLDYIGENNYYYEFRLVYNGTYLPDLFYTNRLVMYKTSAKYCTFDSHSGYNLQIRALDSRSVLDILDLEAYFLNCLWASQSIIYREFKDTGSEYVYTYYNAYVCGGDWNMYDSAVLSKTEIRVDKTTGEYRYPYGGKSQKLREVIIPGTYHPNPMDFD